MSRFILVDDTLINSAFISEISFFDQAFRITFKTSNTGGNHHKTYDDQESYEVACSNLKSNLEAIYID